MQLPFAVVVEPPTLTELVRLARTWRARVLAALLLAAGCGGALLLTGLLAASREGDTRDPGDAALEVASDPQGASIEVDGHARGQTPARVAVGHGPHQVVLRAPGYLDATYVLSVNS